MRVSVTTFSWYDSREGKATNNYLVHISRLRPSRIIGWFLFYILVLSIVVCLGLVFINFISGNTLKDFKMLIYSSSQHNFYIKHPSYQTKSVNLNKRSQIKIHFWKKKCSKNSVLQCKSQRGAFEHTLGPIMSNIVVYLYQFNNHV